MSQTDPIRILGVNESGFENASWVMPKSSPIWEILLEFPNIPGGPSQGSQDSPLPCCFRSGAHIPTARPSVNSLGEELTAWKRDWSPLPHEQGVHTESVMAAVLLARPSSQLAGSHALPALPQADYRDGASTGHAPVRGYVSALLRHGVGSSQGKKGKREGSTRWASAVLGMPAAETWFDFRTICLTCQKQPRQQLTP